LLSCFDRIGDLSFGKFEEDSPDFSHLRNCVHRGDSRRFQLMTAEVYSLKMRL